MKARLHKHEKQLQFVPIQIHSNCVHVFNSLNMFILCSVQIFYNYPLKAITHKIIMVFTL